jgi:hypothetical protein
MAMATRPRTIAKAPDQNHGRCVAVARRFVSGGLQEKSARLSQVCYISICSLRFSTLLLATSLVKRPIRPCLASPAERLFPNAAQPLPSSGNLLFLKPITGSLSTQYYVI